MSREVVDFLGARLEFRATGAETGGALSLSSWTCPVDWGWGPRHVHDWTDETLIVDAGRFTFMVGDRLISGGPGTVAHVPAGTPHTLRSEEGNSVLIVALIPATHEAFFLELSRRVGSTEPYPDDATMRAIGERHGWRLVEEHPPVPVSS